MTCTEHHWPHSGPDTIQVRSYGWREVWTCNNCLATKVIIETYASAEDGTLLPPVEIVVEPHPWVDQSPLPGVEPT